jgi:hypothetical protein
MQQVTELLFLNLVVLIIKSLKLVLLEEKSIKINYYRNLQKQSKI